MTKLDASPLPELKRFVPSTWGEGVGFGYKKTILIQSVLLFFYMAKKRYLFLNICCRLEELGQLGSLYQSFIKPSHESNIEFLWEAGKAVLTVLTGEAHNV